MSEWINHNGAPRQPVDNDVRVDVRHRYLNSLSRNMPASRVSWPRVAEYRLAREGAEQERETPDAPPTVFIYGPQGCGKTHNAGRLRAYFGCTSIINDFDTADGGVYSGGLHLCVTAPVWVNATGGAGSIRVYPYETAMEMLAKWEDAMPQAVPEPALAVQEGGNHYKDMAIQPAEYIHANALGYFEGNVVKYVSRWRKKNGIEDLKKARHYVDLLIELENKKV